MFLLLMTFCGFCAFMFNFICLLSIYVLSCKSCIRSYCQVFGPWNIFKPLNLTTEVITSEALSSPPWYSRACGSYHDFLVANKESTDPRVPSCGLSWTWSHHFESFMVDTMTWLIVTKHLCHKWPRICSVWCDHNPVLSSLTCHRVCTTTGGHIWSWNCLPIRSPFVHLWFLVRFVFLDL